jgi:hypothetical protein
MSKREKRLGLLYEDDIKYSKSEIAEMWFHYRVAKQYACMGDVCERIASFALTEQEFTQMDYKESVPSNRSPYWIETIEVPRGFAEREIY